jgi:hypothetical protein
MADDTQPVVDATKDQAEPGTAGTDARKADDLETLLAEFEAGTKKPAETTAPSPKRLPIPLRPRRRRASAGSDRAELAEEAGPTRSQAGHRPRSRGKVARRVLRRRDRGLPGQPGPARSATGQCLDEPSPESHSVGQGGGCAERADVAKFSKLPDKAATEDRAAVTAAVRGASTKAPEGKAPSYGKMSDAEYNKDVEQKFGFRPL